MRSFWICLLVSVGLHLLFFQDVLQTVMGSGKADTAEVRTPTPVKITLRKEPRPLVKEPVRPQVKPKPAAKPKPIAKMEPPKPKLKRNPPASRPVTHTPSRPNTISKPRYPKTAPQRTQSRPPTASNRRLSAGPSSHRHTHSKVVVPTSDGGPAGGKAGVVEDQKSWTPPDNSHAGRFPDSGSSGEDADDNGKPGPASPAEPKSEPTPPPPREPNPSPSPKTPEPTPKPPKGGATHTPKMREVQIAVPRIEPPAKFRHEKLKGELKVRFNVSPDGSFEVTLSDSSGNKEFDDFVVERIRATASVQPAIDENGQAKRSVVRRPVEINIE